ncbi:hypothetical protein Q3G72_013050 [Acer saccharum]|nr:hypothetical protein Q3G72_013050 [Acer saccharum]
MKIFFFKRHCSSSLTTNNPETQILHYCKSGALSGAIHLLNSTDYEKTSLKQPIVYASLLQTCIKVVSFAHGLQIHAHVIKSGLQTDRFVGNSLLSLYFKLGPDFSETRKVFDGLFIKDVISWTSMISGYVKVRKPNNALGIFWEMLGLDVEPNGFTLSAVIKACSELGFVRLGRCFHGVVMIRGFNSNHVISSALIDMYGRNYESKDARQLFDELPEPDAICWTSVISAFTRNDMYEKALEFFYLKQKQHEFLADGFTFGTVLTACGNLGRLKQGKEMHAKIITSGLCGNVVVESSLVDMYGKCRSVDESQRVFDRMLIKNSISWSALLGVYCQNGDFATVIRIFREMEETDLYSFGTVLRACAGLAAVRLGKEVHCHHTGLVSEGRKYFTSMTEEHGIKPGIEHYNCMVHLLGRAGFLEEAETLIDEADCRDDSSLWVVLLGACTTCTNSVAAERIAKKLMEMEPGNPLSYVLLANLYRAMGRWNDAVKIRSLMNDRGVKKIPGKSWIETNSNLNLDMNEFSSLEKCKISSARVIV